MIILFLGSVLNCEEDFNNLPIDADIYCTGSDQTWNSGWYGRVLKSYFLTFCPNRVKKYHTQLVLVKHFWKIRRKKKYGNIY